MANTRVSANSVVVNLNGTDANIPRSTISALGNITGGNINTANSVVANNIVTRTITVTGLFQAANLSTGGNVSAVGTVTANAFTGGPINVSSIFVPSGPISASGNITGGNIRTVGQVTATGNITGNYITANYFVGNGSQITGLTSQLSGTMVGNIIGNGYSISGVTSVGVTAVSAGSVTASGNVRAAAFLNTNGTPYQSPGGPTFSASVSGPFSFSYRVPNGGAFVPFNIINFDTDNCYNNSTYRFTPTKSGYYQVNTSVGIGPYNGIWPGGAFDLLNVNVTIYKNGGSGGAWSAGSSSSVASGFFYAIAVPALVYMNGTTDYLSIYCSKGFSRSNYYSVTEGSYFQACWLRS
jgi:hypothetical protein